MTLLTDVGGIGYSDDSHNSQSADEASIDILFAEHNSDYDIGGLFPDSDSELEMEIDSQTTINQTQSNKREVSKIKQSKYIGKPCCIKDINLVCAKCQHNKLVRAHHIKEAIHSDNVHKETKRKNAKLIFYALAKALETVDQNLVHVIMNI